MSWAKSQWEEVVEEGTGLSPALGSHLPACSGSLPLTSLLGPVLMPFETTYLPLFLSLCQRAFPATNLTHSFIQQPLVVHVYMPGAGVEK